MKQGTLAVGIALAMAWTSMSPGQSNEVQSNWPHWRGPHFTGTSDTSTPPVEWSEKENLRWKTPIPGLGHSSPVVFGDHIFLTTSIPAGEKFLAKPDTAPGAHDNLLVSSSWQCSPLPALGLLR